MSTPSKRRRKAREWMQTAAKRFGDEGAQRGFREGAARMRDDMMRLLPDPDRGHEDDRGTHLTSMIRMFPDPYKFGPYYRVPMPALPAFGRFASMPKSARYNTVDFRPVEHAITKRTPDGSASLRWFTWEPTEGSDELGERTSALFTGMGKLARAASYLDWFAMTEPSGPIIEARNLLREAAEELRRRLGRFAT